MSGLGLEEEQGLGAKVPPATGKGLTLPGAPRATSLAHRELIPVPSPQTSALRLCANAFVLREATACGHLLHSQGPWSRARVCTAAWAQTGAAFLLPVTLDSGERSFSWGWGRKMQRGERPADCEGRCVRTPKRQGSGEGSCESLLYFNSCRSSGGTWFQQMAGGTSGPSMSHDQAWLVFPGCGLLGPSPGGRCSGSPATGDAPHGFFPAVSEEEDGPSLWACIQKPKACNEMKQDPRAGRTVQAAAQGGS
jgi:hypothetical protein